MKIIDPNSDERLTKRLAEEVKRLNIRIEILDDKLILFDAGLVEKYAVETSINSCRETFTIIKALSARSGSVECDLNVGLYLDSSQLRLAHK